MIQALANQLSRLSRAPNTGVQLTRFASLRAQLTPTVGRIALSQAHKQMR